MRRRGGRRCAGCSVLLAIASILSPIPVTADIMDAMPAFVSRPVHGGIPFCAPHEELCPVSAGSNDLQCVDLTDPKTCGGCVTDGEGLDCTSVPDVFMQQCTSRGQCTGCRWKHGGMNASLEEPDFLSCSIILTQPVQASRHKARRKPQLTFARQLIKEKIAHMGPMAARRPQNNYAADKAVAKRPPHAHAFDALPAAQAYPGIGPGVKQLPPLNALERQRAPGALKPDGGGGAFLQAVQNPGHFIQPAKNPGLDLVPKKASRRDTFPAFELDDIPEPPHWLTAYATSQLSTLPLTDSDDAILGWFQSIETGIVKLGVRFHAMSSQEQKKKISNADRFRLKLPPVPPKALVRPNKPAPFILPGMDYTEEEIEALGLQNYLKTKSEPEEEPEETVTIHDSPSVFWGRLMKTAFASTPKTVRKDVMDALWFLLDTISRPTLPKKQAAALRAPQWGAGERLKQEAFQQGTDQHIKAAEKVAQQNAFLRPGQLAAGKAARPDSNAAAKGNQPVKGANNQLKQKPIALVPKAKLNDLAAKDGSKRQAAPLKPLMEDERGKTLPRARPNEAVFAPRDRDTTPQDVNQLPNVPVRRKPRPADHNAFGLLLPMMDEKSDDPYARERQRPAQKAQVQAEEQRVVARLNENKRTELRTADNGGSEDSADESPTDEAKLLELLALKQQELADLRRKLLLEHKRKKSAADTAASDLSVEPLARPAVKQAELSKPESKEQAAKAPFLKNLKEATPLLPLNAAQNAFMAAQGKRLKGAPLKPMVMKSGDEETTNVFEQHIRKAQKAKVKKLEDQVQPERLLESLEREQLADGGNNAFGRVKNKPMMAGMVKARPDAHLKPDSRPGRGLKQRR